MHRTILETHTERWADEAGCAAAAQALAAQPELRDAFIELAGPLGAGKTTFARHLLRALGVAGRIKSPSYAVVEAYELPASRGPVWHFDFYRFSGGREWQEAGFRELLAGPGLKLVEWAEHASELPVCDLRLELAAQADEVREARFAAHTDRGLALIGALA